MKRSSVMVTVSLQNLFWYAWVTELGQTQGCLVEYASLKEALCVAQNYVRKQEIRKMQ